GGAGPEGGERRREAARCVGQHEGQDGELLLDHAGPHQQRQPAGRGTRAVSPARHNKRRHEKKRHAKRRREVRRHRAVTTSTTTLGYGASARTRRSSRLSASGTNGVPSRSASPTSHAAVRAFWDAG